MRNQPIPHLARLTTITTITTILLALATSALHATTALATETQTCPNEQLRAESNLNPLTQTPYSIELPDCRAYEMVTPPYEGGEIPASLGSVPFSYGESDGELHVIATDLGGFAGDSNSLGPDNNYEFTRSRQGWEASSLDPPAAWFPGGELLNASRSFEATLWRLRRSSQGVHAGSFYLREPASVVESCSPESLVEGYCFVEVGPLLPPSLTEKEPPEKGDTEANEEIDADFEGDSADLSKILFKMSSYVATQPEGDRVFLWPGDTTIDTQPHDSLYEYSGVGDAEPVLVGVSNSRSLKEEAQLEGKQHINEAAQLISQCGTVLGSSESGGDKYNAVSTSGETVFFTAEHSVSTCAGTEPAVNELYARINGEKTLRISSPSYPLAQGNGTGPEECDSACEAAAHKEGVFQGASENGEKVFFLTEQPLLNGDTDTKKDLYEEEIKDGTIDKVVQVSHDPTAGQAAEVQGVARVSEDGSHVYFVAKAKLTGADSVPGRSPEEAEPQAGAENLYVYQRDAAHPTGELTFIATLSASDLFDWRADDERPVQATPNGEFLVFESVADLTPDDTSTTTQVFEYDASTHELVRVSQGQDGFNDDGNTATNAASIPSPLFAGTDSAVTNQNRLAVSEDGSYVFFDSADGLTPNAAASEDDTYEYHWAQGATLAAGEVQLLAAGYESGGGHDAVFLASDASASDVFLLTPAHLVGQDTDTQDNVYDARIDGGFPAPVSPLACAGETCHGSALALPSLPSLGSTAPPAVGNLITPPEAKAEEKPSSTTTGEVKITGRKATSMTITLTVKVPAKGKLTAAGSGVKKTTKSVKGKASYKLKIKLTKAEQKKLKAKKKLSLKVKVAFKAASGKSSSASVKVKLKT